MTHSKSLSRLLIVSVIGVFAAVIINFAMTPPAGLFG